LADRVRWTTLWFDQIGDSQFGALGGHRVPAERSERSEDDEYAFAHIRSNPTLSANKQA